MEQTTPPLQLVQKTFQTLTPLELYGIMKARQDVFIVEQHCAFHDMDNLDQDACHLFLWDGQQVYAYLRVLKAGVTFDAVSIGRVITCKRGWGLGAQIMEAGIAAAQKIYGATVIQIEAQTYARGFYEKFGFRQFTAEFLEDGIPHIGMELRLQEG